MRWRLLLLTALLTACAPPEEPTPAVPPVAVAAPAVAPLVVRAVVPEPDASAVPFDSAVFVQFNRPVVPLTTLDHAATDDPIQVQPPAQGTGRWINTGLYTFTPAPGWAASTTYHISVPQTGYVWSFTTLPPAVASTTPQPDARSMDPAAPVKVTFNQPVDPSGVHITFTPATDGQSEWPDNQTLLFHPDGGLNAGQAYAAQIQLDAAEEPYTWTFQTAPEPAVTRTVPSDGGEAPRLGQVELFFSAPMDRDDVRARITVEPELDHSPFPQWSEDDTHATIYGRFQPETQYTVSLPVDTRDRFGRAMPTAFTLSFRTPASQTSPSAPPVAPQAWLVSPGLVGTFDAYEHPKALLRTTNVSHFDFSVDALEESSFSHFAGTLPTPREIPDGQRVLSGDMDVQFERNVPEAEHHRPRTPWARLLPPAHPAEREKRSGRRPLADRDTHHAGGEGNREPGAGLGA
jgi:hypothetical protein